MINTSRILLFISLFSITTLLKVNAEGGGNSPGTILSKIQRLNTLGCVLYIAAHPDDENTRMLSWLSNGMKVRTCYLSLTRGDGGQNLIGTEQGAALGIVRTQELLSARRIDGAEQYFTRAVDFGYSRNPEETLSKWDEEMILSDVVWMIRNLKPDVIVTRFPATGEGGHGHHTASAMLANKAFRLAADKNAFPEQLEFVEPWQTSRIFFNSFNFRSRPAQDYSGQIHVDVGGYDPLLGKSYGEIASMSRSQHKSQGFGVAISRGSRMEHYKRIDGDTAVSSLFEGIDMSWGRVKGGDKISSMVDLIIKEFDPMKPYLSVTGLFELRKLVSRSEDAYWREVKLSEINELLIACTGLYMSVTSERPAVSTGDSLRLEITALNRSPLDITLNTIKLSDRDTALSMVLKENDPVTANTTTRVPAKSSFSSPFWLMEPAGENPNVYTISNRSMIGKAENEESFTVSFGFDMMGNTINYNVQVTYADVDPVKGETNISTAILPKVTLNIKEGSYLFTQNKSQEVNIEVEAFSKVGDAVLELKLPEKWHCEPGKIALGKMEYGHLSNHSFTITPPDDFTMSGSTVQFGAAVTTKDSEYRLSLQKIDYPHIRPQYHLTPAKADLVPINITGNNVKVGYIIGAGDKVATSLILAGFSVDYLDEDDIIAGRLSEYKTVITGIRAFNKHEWLKSRHDALMEYVKNGGNLIVQYNTNSFFGSIEFNLGPYPFSITRNRVTVEETTPEFLIPEHPILRYPNPISRNDFNDWVQERGLYFAGEIADEYDTLINWNDPGYDPTDGALISCKYGSGHFTYTGISFFRQLPANVQGAYRILTNMIHLGDYESE